MCFFYIWWEVYVNKQMCTGKPSLHMGLQALYKGKSNCGMELQKKRGVGKEWSIWGGRQVLTKGGLLCCGPWSLHYGWWYCRGAAFHTGGRIWHSGAQPPWVAVLWGRKGLSKERSKAFEETVMFLSATAGVCEQAGIQGKGTNQGGIKGMAVKEQGTV